MKSDEEINYRDSEDKKHRCLTCVFYTETDHRGGKGECEHIDNVGDTNKNMMCDLWEKK